MHDVPVLYITTRFFKPHISMDTICVIWVNLMHTQRFTCVFLFGDDCCHFFIVFVRNPSCQQFFTFLCCGLPKLCMSNLPQYSTSLKYPNNL